MARDYVQNFEGATHDATNCLKILWSWNVPYKNCEVRLLLARVKCTALGQDLDCAIIDLRPCCAAIRVEGSRWKREPCIGQATLALLIVMANKKVEEGAARPHYSLKERMSWERELGLGLFEHVNYECFECGETPPPDSAVKLQMCGRCKEVWFCGKKCQRACWKSGHKKHCAPPGHRPIIVADTEEASAKNHVAEKRYCYLRRPISFDPVVIVRDPRTGRLFDSLTDRGVFFSPSENALIDAAVD